MHTSTDRAKYHASAESRWKKSWNFSRIIEIKDKAICRRTAAIYFREKREPLPSKAGNNRLVHVVVYSSPKCLRRRQSDSQKAITRSKGNDNNPCEREIPEFFVALTTPLRLLTSLLFCMPRRPATCLSWSYSFDLDNDGVWLRRWWFPPLEGPISPMRLSSIVV